MKFCTKCGSLMLPKKDGKGHMIMACTSCKFTQKGVVEVKLSEKLTRQDAVSVVDEQQEESTMPTTDEAECEKCGNKTAYYWIIQTRASDEPETKFLKCTKCKHTWRDYT